MATIARSAEMVTMYWTKEDGTTEQVQRWPVDARDCLRYPCYSLTPPGEVPVRDLPAAAPLDPVALGALTHPATTRSDDAPAATVRGAAVSPTARTKTAARRTE